MASSPVRWKWTWGWCWVWASPASAAAHCAILMPWEPSASANWPRATRRLGRCINQPRSCSRWPPPGTGFMSESGMTEVGITESVLEEQRQQRLLNRSHKNLRRDVGRAIADYNMIEEGDLVMVCMSGGKDSYTMLDILLSLQKHAPIDF